MSQEREQRPVGETGRREISSRDKASLPANAGNISAIGLVSGVHVVVVETAAGHFRRRCYFNLPGAQKAADRAIMAGHSASVILCQLMPVTGGAA